MVPLKPSRAACDTAVEGKSMGRSEDQADGSRLGNAVCDCYASGADMALRIDAGAVGGHEAEPY